MVHQSTRDFLAVVQRRRQPKIRLGPQIVAHQSKGIAEGRHRLDVPGGAADGAGLVAQQAVRQQGDEREEAEEGWRGAGNRLVTPLALSSRCPDGRGSPRR